MRILGFSRKWDKFHLELPVDRRPPFTTFRFPRKDASKGRDWHQDEQVQIIYHHRSQTDREYLGNGLIVAKYPKLVREISDNEARTDGFPSGYPEMLQWLAAHSEWWLMTLPTQWINKLFIEWIK